MPHQLKLQYDDEQLIKSWSKFISGLAKISVATTLAIPSTASVSGVQDVAGAISGKSEPGSLATKLLTHSFRLALRNFLKNAKVTDEEHNSILKAMSVKNIKGYLVVEQKFLQLEQLSLPSTLPFHSWFAINVLQENSLNTPENIALWKQSVNIGFAEAWAENPTTYSKILKFFNPPNIKSIQSDIILSAHAAWIQKKYQSPIMGGRFTIEDVYVPIDFLAENRNSGGKRYETISSAEYLNSHMYYWPVENGSPKWNFIAGGPGSGKSTLALRYAAKTILQSEYIVIFIRFSRSHNDLHLDFSNSQEIVDDRYSVLSFLDVAKHSSSDNICLILDGLDEIGTYNDEVSAQVSKTLQIIDGKIKELVARGKMVFPWVFGRPTITQHAKKFFANDNKVLLMMADMTGHHISDDLPLDENEFAEKDLRPVWWNKFTKSVGYIPTKEPPTFLIEQYHQLFSLGREPLPACLMCIAALEANASDSNDLDQLVNDYSNDTNRNKIYRNLIGRIRTSTDWRETTNNESKTLSEGMFVSVMQRIAIATWQEGSNVTASIFRIRSVIRNPEILKGFEALVTGYLDKDERVENLVAAFYFKIGQIGGLAEEHQFEFTHKTFSEYLISTLLFDVFERLLKAKKISKANQISDEYLKEIRNWFHFTEAGRETADIAEFISDEANLRFAESGFKNWDLALQVIQDILYMTPESRTNIFEVDGDNSKLLKSFNKVERLKKSCLTIFTLWGSLNRARYESTGERISLKDLQFDEHEILNLQSHSGAANRPVSGKLTRGFEKYGWDHAGSFLGHGLTGLIVDNVIWSGLFLSGGDIDGSVWDNIDIQRSVFHKVTFADCIFRTVDFKQSHFNEVNFMRQELDENITSFEGGDFSHSVFKESSFIGILFDGTNFRFSDCANMVFQGAVFQEVDFRQSEISDSSFDDCKFINCKFQNSVLSKVGFEKCDFNKCNFTGTETPITTGHEHLFYNDTNEFVDCTGLPLQ